MVRKGYKLLANTLGESLLIGIISGCVCILVDFDHPIAWALGIENGRFLHPYSFAFVSGIVFGCCAYVGGLLIKSILRRNHA